MPANSLPDPALVLLYLCITNSDITKIDFEAVGAAAGLKANAARMRWLRLKSKIESGFPDGKVTMGAGAGEANADADVDEDQGQLDKETAGGAEPVSPSPSKKRKTGTGKEKETPKKVTLKDIPKGMGKGKGKAEQAQRDVEKVAKEDDSVCVKSEGAGDGY
ncbi:hypothetical protein BDW66DRAFT_147531 [Aspergillus desertorum]